MIDAIEVSCEDFAIVADLMARAQGKQSARARRMMRAAVRRAKGVLVQKAEQAMIQQMLFGSSTIAIKEACGRPDCSMCGSVK